MTEEKAILDLVNQLLHFIRKGDLENYRAMCADNLTAFEPESKGAMVRGLKFHDFFIERMPENPQYNFEIIDPVVHIQGDGAVVAYTLLTQRYEGGAFKLAKVNETRVFHRIDGVWKLVHFHRS